jgi:YD repeat-containing protein
MRHVITCIVLILVVTSHNAFGQMERPYIPPSPNASSLIRSANVEVGYYSGVPNITVPITNLSGRDVSVAISLAYHASGIKVQDVASSVGLGWNLNAGGAITRMVRGKPDGSVTYCGSGNTTYYNNQAGLCDGERDIFYFSILGRTGKMFIDGSNAARTMPYQDIEISQPVVSASIGYWKIVDESGYVYYFGEQTSTRESSIYFTGNYISNAWTQKETFVSTWYLERVVSPKGDQVATFSYLTGGDIEYIMYGEKGFDCENNNNETITRNDLKIKITQPKYLSSVSTSIASAIFTYGDRSDLTNGKYLSQVLIKDFDNLLVKTFDLDFGYFPCYSQQGILSSSNCRLKLNSVREQGLTTQTFSYKVDLPVVGSNRLPERSSFFEDHWGYYNWYYTAGGTLAYNKLPPAGTSCGGVNKAGGSNADVFILEQIEYLQGDKTKFEYELNQYSTPFDGYASSTNGGGLRIKSISKYIGNNVIDKVSYMYSQGQAANDPIYYYRDPNNKVVRASTSFKSIFDGNGVSVGYSTVTETMYDGSKVVRAFTNFSDYYDLQPSVNKYEGTPLNPSYIGTAPVDGLPFTSYSSRSEMRGLLKSIEIKDASGNSLQKEEMIYIDGDPISQVFNNAVEVYKYTGGSSPTMGVYVGNYWLRSSPVHLMHKYTYSYDQSDPNKKVVDNIQYAYHPSLLTFPTSIDSYRTTPIGGEPHTRINFRYPTDIIGPYSQGSAPDQSTFGLWALMQNHIITSVENLRYAKNYGESSYQIVGGELITFRKNSINGKPLINQTYKLAIGAPITNLMEANLTNNGNSFAYDSRYQLMSSVLHDDVTSRMIQVNDRAGLTRYYNWGYNNSLVTSDYYTLGATQYKTEYTYNTINGLVTTTDDNNRVSRFEYDKFGRLKLIKDHDNNILSRYRYNYGSNNEFTVSFSKNPSTAVVGQTVSLSCTAFGESSGITHYLWDYGDGQVVESGPNVTHAYSSPGTYTLKLSKVNTEYGSVITTQSLTVNPLPAVSISTCGTIDLCQGSSCDVSASGTGGCAALSYTWYYKQGTGSWYQFNSGSSAVFTPLGEGTFNVKCIVNDGCGNSAESTLETVTAYRSSNCPQN